MVVPGATRFPGTPPPKIMDHTDAIPTWHGSTLYRSRLEANWARAFELTNFPVTYEPELFKLPNGLCYLPDFQAVDARGYLEIKPAFQAIDSDDWAKIRGFAQLKPLLLLVGQPWNHSCLSVGKNGNLRGIRLAYCPERRKIGFCKHVPTDMLDMESACFSLRTHDYSTSDGRNPTPMARMVDFALAEILGGTLCLQDY